MKLKKVQITNFRSIEDTTEFDIENMTCLVGKNEAGKTAILQALEILRPYERDGAKIFDRVNDYPRRSVTKFDELHPNGQAVVAKTWWILSSEAREKLETEFGPDAITSDTVTIEGGYGYQGTVWDVPIDEMKAIAHFLGHFKLDAIEQQSLKKPVSLASLISGLESTEERSEKQSRLLTYVSDYRDQSISKKGIDLIKNLVPKFQYFSHYDRMSGEISVEQLIQHKQEERISKEDQIFLDFLNLAGTTLEDLRDTTRYEALNSKCEAASNAITDQILEYWTQNADLEVGIAFSQGGSEDKPPFNSGTVVRARVKNTLHRASVPFSERSAGFVWFFSFLVQFAEVRKDAGNIVILLDEPGLTLHGTAQANLLRYIEEKLLPHHQVLFSTHSPFMVPAQRLDRVRIVEDVVDRSGSLPRPHGTKVSSEVLATDKDTLFPLQGALGYDISQSLFIGANTLLVEGPSDILYLQAFSDALKKRGREGLDSRWVMCPSGGIDKIQPFVSLFGGNRINVAVLSDFAQGNKKKLDRIRQSQILKAGHLLTAADFTDSEEADIEDFFEPELFVEIVNKAYELGNDHALSVSSLSEVNKNTTLLVKKVEAAFNVMPDQIPTYDHFTPSSWLIRNLQILDGKEKRVLATLDRAERAFNTINRLPPHVSTNSTN